MAEPPPLYRDAMVLAGSLLEELEEVESFPELRRRLQVGGLALLDQVGLACAGLDRGASLFAADTELEALRGQLHLAAELGMVEEEAFIAFLDQADRVGRQIGGWRRSLEKESR